MSSSVGLQADLTETFTLPVQDDPCPHAGICDILCDVVDKPRDARGVESARKVGGHTEGGVWAVQEVNHVREPFADLMRIENDGEFTLQT